MSYTKDTFTRFKVFTIESSRMLKNVFSKLSISNIKEILKVEYSDLKEKLLDLKGTNWKLALYHFVAGNHNDAILRLTILRKKNYKFVESNYLLGRIYLEKGNIKKSREYLDEYLKSENSDYKLETQYCMSIINNEEITSIPNSIIRDRRDRTALNLERSEFDDTLISHYNAIIRTLKVELNNSSKILEVGCYIGILGRIIRENFLGNIQYLAGSELGVEASEIALAMSVDDYPVYDNIKRCSAVSQLISDDNSYSFIIGADILSYYCDLLGVFVQILTTLQNHGIAVVVARVVKDSGAKDIEFLHPIEEFRYSYENIVRSAQSCGLQLKSSSDIGNGFELFVFKKV